MIDTWLEGVQELLVRTPGGLARWSCVDFEQAKLRRVFFDMLQDGDDVAKARPFFVVQESELVFTREMETGEALQPSGSVEVLYTEAISDTNDRKASKLDFCQFVGGLATSIGDRQGKPIDGDNQTSYIPIERLAFKQMPIMGDPAHEDPDIPGTAYFWCSFVLTIG